MSDDGLGKHVGRVKNLRREGDKVRGNLLISNTAMDTPIGGGRPLGAYLMDLAESDPGALGMSLVLQADKF